MSLNTPKLDAKLRERDVCRATYQALRSERAEKERMCRVLNVRCVELGGEIHRAQIRFSELTTEAAQLLHADLAGVVGGGDVVGDAAVENGSGTTAEAQP